MRRGGARFKSEPVEVIIKDPHASEFVGHHQKDENFLMGNICLAAGEESRINLRL